MFHLTVSWGYFLWWTYTNYHMIGTLIQKDPNILIMMQNLVIFSLLGENVESITYIWMFVIHLIIYISLNEVGLN